MPGKNRGAAADAALREIEDLFVKENSKNAPQVYLRRGMLVLLDAVIVAFSFYFALLLRADGAV